MEVRMRRVIYGLLLAIFIAPMLLISSSTTIAQIKFRKCPSFFLRTESGEIINPIAGKNSNKPYSTRQTCGLKGCHDYDKITKGYHFQQGWDKISDNFSKDKPWVISDGMMGKV